MSVCDCAEDGLLQYCNVVSDSFPWWVGGNVALVSEMFPHPEDPGEGTQGSDEVLHCIVSSEV